MNWFIGDLPQIEVNATDPKAKTPVTPSSVTMRVITPLGIEATNAMTELSQGRYVAAVELTEAGKWYAIIKATGVYQGVRRVILTCRGL